jgi:hypothetical protein
VGILVSAALAEPAIKGSKPAPAANKNTPVRCKLLFWRKEWINPVCCNRQWSMLCIAEGGK